MSRNLINKKADELEDGSAVMRSSDEAQVQKAWRREWRMIKKENQEF